MNKKKVLALGLLFSVVAVNAEDTPPSAASGQKGPQAEKEITRVKEDGPGVATSQGYFGPAWEAVKQNRVMTAALVTTAFFLGAVAHAAISTNDVEEDNE